MPSNSPRRPPQPVRRPKVAGLRRPSPSPSPRPRPKPDPAPEETVAPKPVDVPEEIVAPETREAAEPDKPASETAESQVEDTPPRPSPRRKSRDTGVAKPSDYAEAENAVAAEPEPKSEAEAGEDKPRRARNPFVIAGALFAAALVLAGLAAWFKIEDNKLSTATSNTALLDVARTSQVNQAATSAVETLFSYDFNAIAKTQNAAKDLLLNDDVKAKYNGLMGEVERLAPQQKLVVTVKASRSAVLLLDGDRAKVMVFVDQTATRTDQNQTSSGSAQLWVTMQYVDGKWKIDNLNTYDSPSPATPTPSPAPTGASSAPAPSR